MKRQALTLVSVLSLLLVAGSAFAQTIHVRANVPFNFIVDKETLPSGLYDVTSLGIGSGRTLLLRDSEGKPVRMIMTNAVSSLQPSSKTKLVFERYADRYFLSQIWVEGNDQGHELQKGAREAEMALDYSPEKVVVIAELR